MVLSLSFKKLKNSILLDDHTSRHRFRRRQVIISTTYIIIDYIRRLQQGKEQRAPPRRLKRANLIPNPRFQTPWQQLYYSQDDGAYITTMGLDVDSFRFVMSSGFRQKWNTTPISRNDVSAHGNPRPGRRSLDAAGGLGLVLHWLRSSVAETSLIEIFALVPSVVERYLDFGLTILLGVLRNMADSRITWPSGRRMAYYSSMIQARHPLIEGAFGFMDGLSLPVSVSADPQLEKATYNGWLHTHKISNILVFAPDGTIIAATLNAPGSWHDARVAQEVYTKLIADTPANHFLIADSAFPRTSPVLQAKIRTPFKRNARLPRDPEARLAAITYSNALVSARQAAEWGMRALQGSFGRLRVPLDINSPQGRMRLLEIVVRLHNLRTRLVGLNQIRTVYMRQWCGQDENWFDQMQNMEFGAIRRNDRVARYYYRYN